MPRTSHRRNTRADDGLFTLRPMPLDDAAAVRHLWDARFGAPRSTQDNWIDAAVDPTRSAEGFIAEGTDDEEVLGFSFLEVGNRTYTRQYLGLEALEIDAPLADENGIFHLSCVRADAEGQGIGSAFYARRLDVLADRDVSTVFGIAWHRPHTVDSRVLFDTWDFTRLATIDRYYTRTGGRPHCPDCEGPCTCTASLYRRPVSPT